MSETPMRSVPGPFAAPTGRDLLGVEHYQMVFRVLEACDSATSLPAFRDLLLASLQDTYRVGSVTFFAGATMQQARTDRDAVLTGITRGLLEEYQDRWCDMDVFAGPDTIDVLQRTGVASLRELARPSQQSKVYLSSWLDRFDLRSGTAMTLHLPNGRASLVGLFDRDVRRVGAGELASLRLLVQPLNRILATLPATEVASQVRHCTLSPRQAEVAEKVGQGLSNRAIAQALHLQEDSVKKYVSRILHESGCQNRTELALRVRAGQI